MIGNSSKIDPCHVWISLQQLLLFTMLQTLISAFEPFSVHCIKSRTSGNCHRPGKAGTAEILTNKGLDDIMGTNHGKTYQWSMSAMIAQQPHHASQLDTH
jgi:hypothetical protein